jgi:hypothetical protein
LIEFRKKLEELEDYHEDWGSLRAERTLDSGGKYPPALLFLTVWSAQRHRDAWECVLPDGRTSRYQ